MYSFLGWVLETIYAFIVLGRFSKRGFLFGVQSDQSDQDAVLGGETGADSEKHCAELYSLGHQRL